MANKSIEQFSLWLDQLLGILPGQPSNPLNHPMAEPAAQAVIALHALDFEAELAPRSGLRTRWAASKPSLGPGYGSHPPPV